MSHNPDDLTQRVTALEAEVALLRTKLDTIAANTARPTPLTPPAQSTAVASANPQPPPNLLNSLGGVEKLLSRGGLLLLLLGVGFLFKYSIDQGWVTPLIRVLFGVALGVGLLILGFRLWRSRNALGQLLAGGGIATFYLSIYAAFNFYGLLPYWLAFGLMCAVTTLAFGIAMRQNAQSFAIVALLGGFATPFVLESRSNNVLGLLMYNTTLVAGGGAVYVLRGWWTVHALAAAGGSVVMLIAASMSLPSNPDLRLQIQIALLGFALPVAFTPFVIMGRGVKTQLGVTRFIVFALPFFAILFSRTLWGLSQTQGGLLWLAITVIYGLLAWGSSKNARIQALAPPHRFVLCGAAILTISGLITNEYVTFMALCALSVVFTLSTWYFGRAEYRASNYGLLFGLGVFFMARVLLNESDIGTPFLNEPALALAGLPVALLAATWREPQSHIRKLLWMAAYLAVLILLGYELSRPQFNRGLITAVWGVYSMGLLILALARRLVALRWVALITLLLVIGKLFLSDLNALDAIWRVLLFMGFGALLLAISYFMPKLGVRQSTEN